MSRPTLVVIAALAIVALAYLVTRPHLGTRWYLINFTVTNGTVNKEDTGEVFESENACDAAISAGYTADAATKHPQACVYRTTLLWGY
jgi:hypothetical protein